MSEFRDYLNEQLKDPEFRAEYDALEPEFTIMQAMIDARKNTGLSQTQLAAKTGIDQSDISKSTTSMKKSLIHIFQLFQHCKFYYKRM